ncbi:MAG: hypothetical protein Q4C87_12025 [Actinomycetaceae bacterium]|nr:hypothetical protein [Actinomycetaceae bacterium]
MYLLNWLTWTPLFIAMLAVGILPGLPWARLAVKSRIQAVALAPAITFSLIPILGWLWSKVGIFWGPGTVIPVYVAVGLLGAALLLWRHKSDTENIADQLRGWGREALRSGWSVAAAACGGLLLSAAPMMLFANPVDPPQQWDSTFHLNGVWAMIHEGNASPVGGLSALYGGDQSVFYPNSWHAFVALFSTPDTVVQAGNISNLFLTSVWVIGAAGLVRTLTADRTVVVIAAVMAGGLLPMPADALTMYNQWPHATGAVMVAAIIIAAVEAGCRLRVLLPGLRRKGDEAPDKSNKVERITYFLAPLIVLGAALIAAAGGHPSAVFSAYFALLFPFIGVLAIGAWRAAKRPGGIFEGLAYLFGIVASIALVDFLLNTESIKGMGRYPRDGIDWQYAITRALSPIPPFVDISYFHSTLFLVMSASVMGVLALVGTMAVLMPGVREETYEVAKDRGSRKGKSASKSTLRVRTIRNEPMIPRWVIVSLLTMAALTFLAYAPMDDIRTFLTAPWYKDPRRIMAIHGMMMVPLASVGLTWLARAGSVAFARIPAQALAAGRTMATLRWEVALAVIALVLSGGAAFESRIKASDYVYNADNLGKPGMASFAELDMVRRMQETLPEDALVIGDPIAGAAYTEVLGHREAVYPQLTLATGDGPTDHLTAIFNQIHTNAEVCTTLNRIGATHFYEDVDGKYYNFNRSDRHPGFYNVNTTSGFELVDQGGTAKLWKITACEPGWESRLNTVKTQ